MYIDGNKMPVPAQVGIAPDSSCLYWLHTHANDGVIHIEARHTLITLAYNSPGVQPDTTYPWNGQ